MDIVVELEVAPLPVIVTGWWRRFDFSFAHRRRLLMLAEVGLLLLMVSVFTFAHTYSHGLPTPGSETGGWATGADQSRYIAASQSWAALDLTAKHHWYPPGYALLAAPFGRITPWDRFLIPNLVSLVVAQLACAAIARRFFVGWSLASLAGASAFLLGSLGTRIGFVSWLVPWTTTPAVAATYLAFVAVMRLKEVPRLDRAMIAGLAVGSIVLFRPSDVFPVIVATGLYLLTFLVAMPRRQAVVIIFGCIVGGGAIAAVAVGAISATTGFGIGTYYAQSAQIGFEIGLIPLRWVTLMISGNPVYDGVGTSVTRPGLHRGMIEVFPWIILGIGGIAACLTSGRAKSVHVMLAIWVMLHTCLLLAYRDLHVLGLWLNGNYHYFKVTQPILLLFAVMLVRLASDRSTRSSLVAATVAIIALFSWRAVLLPVVTAAATTVSGAILLPAIDRLDAAVILRGRPTWKETYEGSHVVVIGQSWYHDVYDFRIYGRDGDMLLIPLRHLPTGRPLLENAARLGIDLAAPVIAARQTIRFGLPCAFRLAGTAICGSKGAPVLPM